MRLNTHVVASLSLAVLALTGPLAACADGLEPRNQVSDLRVLGIQAEPPMVHAGDTVALSALVVDPSAKGPGGQADPSAITYHWYGCALPETFLGSQGGGGPGNPQANAYDGSCLDDPSVMDLGTASTAQVTIPADFLDNADLFAGAFGDQLPAGAKEGLLAVAGLYLRVVLVVETPEKKITTFKRVVVTTAPTLNANPAPPAFVVEPEADRGTAPATATPPPAPDPASALPELARCLSPDSPIQGLSPGVFELAPVNLPEQPETYPVLTMTGEFDVRTEKLFLSWFSTVDGGDRPVTKSTRPELLFTVPADVPADQLVPDPDTQAPSIPVWVVARDARGGTAWCVSYLPWSPETVQP